MLTQRQRSARSAGAKRALITRLCASLDRNVEMAEKFPAGGKTRARYLKKADNFRERLRQIDH
jgi:hypothetical protein